MPSSSPAAGSPSATPSTRPAGALSATTRLTTSPSWPARSSTTTPSSTTGTTSATRARPSATPRCPTSTPLAEFQRNELAPGHKPVMAEIDLVSSHSPWAPLPTMVPWNKVGNGSIFDPMPARGETPLCIFGSASLRCARPTARRSSTRCRPLPHGSPSSTIRTSCSSCSATTSPLAPSPARGPATRCRSRSSPVTLPYSGRLPPGTGRTGCCPVRSAPLEPMDAFRNQFLGAFSTPTPQTASAP